MGARHDRQRRNAAMAAQTMSLPNVGDFESVGVARVEVRVGDRISRGETVLTIESDKATMDLPSPVSGLVTAVYVARGSKVAQGEALIAIAPMRVTEEELRTEFELGRIGALSAAPIKDEPAISPKAKLEGVFVQLRPLFSEIQRNHPQIKCSFIAEAPAICLTLRSEKLEVESSLTWNAEHCKFERNDIVDSTVSKQLLELVALPANAHEQRHHFTYQFEEEALLAIAKWLGWAVGVLEGEAAHGRTDA